VFAQWHTCIRRQRNWLGPLHDQVGRGIVEIGGPAPPEIIGDDQAVGKTAHDAIDRFGRAYDRPSRSSVTAELGPWRRLLGKAALLEQNVVVAELIERI
jgi:hypothetical protein